MISNILDVRKRGVFTQSFESAFFVEWRRWVTDAVPRAQSSRHVGSVPCAFVRRQLVNASCGLRGILVLYTRAQWDRA